jgi:hypothetical protein
MGKFRDLVVEQQRTPKIDKGQLGGWASLSAAYRELSPDVTFGGFRARVAGGKSVIEAATMPRSSRGRPRKIV